MTSDENKKYNRKTYQGDQSPSIILQDYTISSTAEQKHISLF